MNVSFGTLEIGTESEEEITYFNFQPNGCLYRNMNGPESGNGDIMINLGLYDKAINFVKRLRNSYRYRKATEIMRLTTCAHPRLEGLNGVNEQGITRDYGSGNVLISFSENFGDRIDKTESFNAWKERTEIELRGCYFCELTDESCVARNINFHTSDIPQGHHHRVYVKIYVQIRCPSFKHRDNLVNKLVE